MGLWLYYVNILFDNLKLLNKTELYYKIFLSYHIESQINIIHNNSVKHKTLESKYGKEWYKLHIVDNGDQSKLKKVAYSFSAEYYNYLLLRY